MKLYLTAHANRKLRYFIDLCPQEISGFGKLETQVIEGKKFYVVTDFAIFKQVCTSAHSTIDDDALGKFLYEQTKAGEDLSLWRVWWHSHATMKAFFSPTDTGTIDKSTEFPYLVSLVSNHEGEMVARMDTYDPIRHHVDLQVEILSEEDLALKELCQNEINEKVTLETPRPPYLAQSHYRRDDDLEDYGFAHHKKDPTIPDFGTKKWRKLKRKLDIATVGDSDYNYGTAAWIPELDCWGNRRKTKVISISNDKSIFTTPENSKPPLV